MIITVFIEKYVICLEHGSIFEIVSTAKKKSADSLLDAFATRFDLFFEVVVKRMESHCQTSTTLTFTVW